MLGAASKKPFTMMTNRVALLQLSGYQCTFRGHTKQLVGLNRAGEFNSATAAASPDAMANTFAFDYVPAFTAASNAGRSHAGRASRAIWKPPQSCAGFLGSKLGDGHPDLVRQVAARVLI